MDRARLVSGASPNRLPRWFVVALAAAPTAFLLVFYVWPFATLLVRGVRLESITDTLRADSTWRVVWFTLWQAALSTAATLVLGMVPAWAVARFAFPGRRLLSGRSPPCSCCRRSWSAPRSSRCCPTRSIAACGRSSPPTSCSTWPSSCAPSVPAGRSCRTTSSTPRRRSAPGRGGSFAAVTLPLLRPAIVAAACDRVPVHVHVVRGDPGARRRRTRHDRGRGVAARDAARRHRSGGDAHGAAAVHPRGRGRLGGAVAAAARARDRARLAATELRRPHGRQRWSVGATAVGAALVVGVPLVALVERSFRVGDGYSTAAWRSLDGTEIRPGLQLGIDPIGALRRSLTTAAWATLFAV